MRQDCILIKGCDAARLRAEAPELIRFETDEVIAEPPALSEIHEELAAFCIIQALQIELELGDEGAHGSMAETSCLAIFLYPLILHDALFWCHIMNIVWICDFQSQIQRNSSPSFAAFRRWCLLAGVQIKHQNER